MTGEQAGWTTDEQGTRFFRHAGWEVKVLGSESKSGRIKVTCPDKSHEVWVYSDCLVIELDSHRGHEFESVDIPWPVLEAIVDAKRMVNEIRQQGGGRLTNSEKRPWQGVARHVCRFVGLSLVTMSESWGE